MKTYINILLSSALVFGIGGSALADHHAEKSGHHHMKKQMNIVSTAVSAGQFKTLAAALTAADLIKTLEGEGPYTVFAPTDAAFAKLPKGTVESLLKDKAKLKSILLYHVVPGKVLAKDVVKINSAKTAQGKDIAVKVKDKKVLINSATVIKADIEASNGVIHVIDEVILPPAK